MTKRELEEYLYKEPFEPFRIRMADGTAYEVRDPRLAVAMDTRIFLAFPKGGWTLLVLRQVTSVEALPGKGSKGRRKSA